MRLLELKLKKKLEDSGLLQFLLVLVLTLVIIFKGIRTVLRAPLVGPALLLLLSCVALWLQGWWWWAGALVSAVVAGLAAWALFSPSSFRGFFRVRWRYLRIYWPKWGEAMRAAKLTSLDPVKQGETAKMVGVSGNDYVDTITAEMMPGQTVKFFVMKAPGIGQTLGASGCRAVENAKSVHLVDLWLWHDDPLKKLNPKPFEIPEPPADGDWYRWMQTAPKIKILEDGTRKGVDLTRNHWLIVGKSRAGKSTSRLWPYVQQTIPMVLAGRLRYVVIDLKRGMELRAGKPIFMMNGGLFVETIEDAAEVLHAEVGAMMEQAGQMGVDTDRATSARGITRKLVDITPERPWTVVIFDELLRALNPSVDPKIRTAIYGAILEFQQIGLACGWTSVAAVQQGHKAILEQIRNGYTARDVLAVAEKAETYMLFDANAIDQYGIAPHELHIPEPEEENQRGDQGIGWDISNGYPRGRGFEFTDDDIWDLRQLLPSSFDPEEPAPVGEEEPELQVLASAEPELKPRPSLQLTRRK